MLFFINDLHTPQRKLIRLLGVDWLATQTAWLGLPLHAAAGFLLALWLNKDDPLQGRVLAGLSYGLIVYASNFVHTLGHVLSSRAAGAPMSANLITATFHLNIYPTEPSVIPRRQHVTRALGGPLANLLVGVVTLAASVLTPNKNLSFSAWTNLAVGLYCLLPLPGIDGWVLWGRPTRAH